MTFKRLYTLLISFGFWLANAPHLQARVFYDHPTRRPVHDEAGISKDQCLEDQPAEKRNALRNLKKYIYSKLPDASEAVPPVDAKGQVSITSAVSVMSVVSVDDAQQSVKTKVCLFFVWRDESLSWNVSQHGGVESIELPVNALWTPNVVIANSLNIHVNLFTMMSTAVELRHTGEVCSGIDFVVDTMCQMDLTMYPYDEQFCPLFLYSFFDYVTWNITNDGRRGVLLAESLSYGNEWDLLDTRAEVFHMKEYRKAGPMVTMWLKRRTTFYTVCLVLPMALTSYMNTLVFLVPLQSGEKVSILVTICVSTSVFVSYFTAMMPRGLVSVPASMKLLICVLAESLLCLFFTIVVLRRSHSEQQEGLGGQSHHDRAHHEGCDPGKDIDQGHQEKVIMQGDTKGICRNLCWFGGSHDHGHQSRQTSTVCSLASPPKEIPLNPTDVKVPFKNEVEVKASDGSWLKSWRLLRAEELDRLFFWITFVGNTTFLSAIIICSLSSSEHNQDRAGF